MKKIEMGKKYKTRSGLSARILCVDRANEHLPVVALVQHTPGTGCMEYMESYTENGYHNSGCVESSYDLLEVSEWDDFKIDEPVMVQDIGHEKWQRRHFAGVVNGSPVCWSGGATSWGAAHDTDYVAWRYCRRPTPGELSSTSRKLCS